MSYLYNLKNSLLRLQNQKNNIESKINKYKQRKREIQYLIKNLTNIGDDYYSKVNKYGDKIINNLPTALKGSISVNRIINDVSSQKEKSSSYDGKLSLALDDLKTELLKIESKINSLNSELITAKNKINNTKVSIKNEERVRKEKEKNT